MEVTEFNNAKVYCLSAAKSLPQFLEEARKKQVSLRKNEAYRKRIDIIQDFEFNIASTRVAVSPDGSFLGATGTYPPEVRLFECRDMGMKCDRRLNCEVVDFMFLSDDYKKLVFLFADRTVEFHAQGGYHHRIRVPKTGRSIAYYPENCTLLVAGSDKDVFRLDLEVGTFQVSAPCKNLEEVNQVVVNPVLPMYSCGGDKGLVESYDLRDAVKPLRSLQVCAPTSSTDGSAGIGDVTCCAYSPNGMYFAAGTDRGLVRVYDVRSSRPLAERDHMNGFKVRSVAFHTRDDASLLVGSADSRAVKIWEANTGKMVVSAESRATINQLVFYPNSGMFFTANDQQRIGVYFVPVLGLAPKWCSFLDSITEELEEGSKDVVFDDFHFVTTEELEQLGAKELIGTKYLQPYMHGYFMDHRLYKKLSTAMDPFRFEEYRKEKIRQKLESKRTMRTQVKAGKVGVNAKLHQELQQQADDGAEVGISKKRKEAADRAQKLLAEERFKAIFEDPDFAIEETGVGSKPVMPAPQKKRKKSKA